jgi:acyl-CoA thioester hydrolase
MTTFHFYHPIEVRYGDLDPQGHVNNAKYLTYLEQARLAYILHLGLWQGGSFLELGIIVADARLTYRKPVLFGTPLRAGVAVTRLGNKSLTSEYSLEDARDSTVFATGSIVLVTYDYASEKTIVIPPAWRQIITHFEQTNLEGNP